MAPPIPNSPKRPEFLVTLGLIPPCTVEDVKQAYLERSKSAHPDRGGDAGAFVQLHKAYEQALEYAEFRASRMGWLAKQVENYVAQEKVVDRLIEMGAKVEVEPIDWLKRSFGEDFAQVVERIVSLKMTGPEIGDDQIAFLAQERKALASLQSLDLSRSSISDPGLAHLFGLTNLKRLDLSGTRLTRPWLEILFKLPELQELVLTDIPLNWRDRRRLRRVLRGVTLVFDPQS